MKNTDNSNMVLRYHLGFENTEKRFLMLTDFLKRTGIHRIILFSAPFVEVDSILPEDYYQQHVKMLAPYVEKLRQSGIEVGINMMYTLGHCFYTGNAGFRRAVTIDGSDSNGCICSRDEKIWKYIKTIYGYYAELHPSVIFADDDVRSLSLGQLTCFCKTHLELISKRVGKEISLKEIKNHIFNSGYGDDSIRNAYFEQVKEDINNIFEIIADSVHAISPETEIGIMTTSYPEVTLDRDLNEFFNKFLKSRKITRIRTGMNFYREGTISEIPKQFFHPVIQRDFIDNSNVEIQPEIENDIYGLYQKSNSVTRLQIIWCLTNGFRNMQLNIFDFIDYPAANYDEITDMLSVDTAYRNKITELIPENHRTEGIYIYTNPKSAQKNDGKLQSISNWYSWLQLMGLPMSAKAKNAEFIMLVGDDIASASDEEIDCLLKKGAVIDLKAAQIIAERGFAARIGIENIKPLTASFAGERLTQNEMNGEFKGAHNSYYFNPSLINNHNVAKITYKSNGTLEVLSQIINLKREVIANGAVAYENKNGERFFIIPVADDGMFVYFTSMNHKRRCQLINAWNWITGKKLPVCVENERVCVNINCFDSYNVITLFNLSCDELSNQKLFYQPRGALKYLDNDGNLKELNCKIYDGMTVIKKRLKAFDVLVIVDEEV